MLTFAEFVHAQSYAALITCGTSDRFRMFVELDSFSKPCWMDAATWEELNAWQK